MEILDDIKVKLDELRELREETSEIDFWAKVASHMTQTEQTELLMTLNDEIVLIKELQETNK